MVFKEEFLHYLWQFQLWNKQPLLTTTNQMIQVYHVGSLNQHAGPDFFNAKININNTIWAGNVEIHLRSSDWNLHQHSQDKAYGNVILHVVYEHDTEIEFLNQNNISTLELKNHVPNNLLLLYSSWQDKTQRFIPCQDHISSVPQLTVSSWLTNLLFERLEQKSNTIKQSWELSNDWEAVLFKEIAKVFGLKINELAMVQWANSFDFKLVRRYHHNAMQLEALFFGMAGFLDEPNTQDSYQLQLATEFEFLKNKHQLTPINASVFKLFRLRPVSFPTIRLALLAAVYHQYQQLFSLLINTNNANGLVPIFKPIKTNAYWNKHYVFGKESSKSTPKSITKNLINSLAINCLIPLQFAYFKQIGKNPEESIVHFYESLPTEDNQIISQYKALGLGAKNSAHSQALLQLNKYYCKPKKCLSCRIGHHILNHGTTT